MEGIKGGKEGEGGNREINLEKRRGEKRRLIEVGWDWCLTNPKDPSSFGSFSSDIIPDTVYLLARMPGIVLYNRRWSLGSDDILIPAAFLALVHTIW